MCLTVPRRVEKVEKGKALMQDGRWVSAVMIGKVKAGDYLLVSANLAVEKVSDDEVKEMKRLITN